MTSALRTFGRILARYWPALIAWYVGGEAVHRVLVQLAGFVGGHTTLGGLLLLPLAVAARLVSYVAMYLVVRPALRHSAHDAAGGIREFGGAMLAAILPFFAFYAAWGMLDADLRDFANIASEVAFAAVGFDGDLLGDRGGLISASPVPVVVLLVALALRIVLSRWRARLPAWTAVVAAYAEVLWTFMLFTLVGQWWLRAQEWLGERVAASWLQGIGDWFALHVAPVAAVWEGLLWLVGILMAAVVVPAAWLTVAGVIFGTSFDHVPSPIRRGRELLRGTVATALARTLIERLESLWAALALVWRGGPLLFGSLLVGYALWGWAEQAGTRGVLTLIGAHESVFWEGFLPLITLGIAAVAEPLRVALIATAYDAVIARPEAGLDTAPEVLDVPEPADEAAPALFPGRLPGEAAPSVTPGS